MFFVGLFVCAGVVGVGFCLYVLFIHVVFFGFLVIRMFGGVVLLLADNLWWLVVFHRDL